MNSTEELLLYSFKKQPIGNTDHFTWFITDIGVVALFKEAENYEIYNSNVEIEANNIALDITKEEKEYLQINEKDFSYSTLSLNKIIRFRMMARDYMMSL